MNGNSKSNNKNKQTIQAKISSAKQTINKSITINYPSLRFKCDNSQKDFITIDEFHKNNSEKERKIIQVDKQFQLEQFSSLE
jgi:ribosome-binding factor A